MSAETVPQNFKVILIMCVYNEEDVIRQVLEHHIRQGIDVYVMDNNSTDRTAEYCKNYLGNGVLHIETFPQDCGYPEQNEKKFVLRDILRRKEELANSLDGDWYIHGDADELRESPWPDCNLREAIWRVHKMGYNVINHKNYHFLPTEDSHFTPGADLLQSIPFYFNRQWFVSPQMKIFKKPSGPLNITTHGGHILAFPGRKVFPLRFLLLHFPLRSESHGRQKVDQERTTRYSEDGLKSGWHTHYKHLEQGQGHIVHSQNSSYMVRFDLQQERLHNLSDFSHAEIMFQTSQEKQDSKWDFGFVLQFLQMSNPGLSIKPDEVVQVFKVISGILQQYLQGQKQFSLTDLLPVALWPVAAGLCEILEARHDVEQDPPTARCLLEIRQQALDLP